ncbi:MAG TPA: c-type cytochrome [Ideonella sp.]|uniref:cytochrome c oxidase subunit II n=1 Tax=Ideonella sp. TaxID=1929293 RepID=UPI002E3554C8|nr:c-type cytochrome [Ideonella sp.]HEX5683816.1 c-type cytochrome [Ideonella sp.]
MDWLNAPASQQAGLLAEVGWVLVAGAALIFLLTMGLLALALRRRKREIPTAWWTVGAGIAFPSVVLGALLAYAVLRTAALERPPIGAPVVIGLTGHLWWWEIRYHDPASGRWIIGANELHLPAGRPVQLGLQSADVIHSFWVPTLGGKMDLVPGRTNRLFITALAPGVHRGVCAEYCGTQHARMALHVVVETPEQFDRWLAAQSAAAPAPTNATLERSRRAFLDHGCAGCHVVRGVAEGASLGPDLTHVGSRLYLGAGTLPNDRDALARWIANPQDFKPGARMPSFQHLDRETLDALADYLSHLR